MALIYETPNFSMISAERPFISREEGGHIIIVPKVTVSDRTKLTPNLAKEYMKLSMIVGESLKIALGRRGIEIGIVNYQDMGNWGVFKPEGPHLHMHILGRAKTAKIQKFGEAAYLPQRSSGFYDDFKPLNEEDIKELRTEIINVAKSDKYKNF